MTIDLVRKAEKVILVTTGIKGGRIFTMHVTIARQSGQYLYRAVVLIDGEKDSVIDCTNFRGLWNRIDGDIRAEFMKREGYRHYQVLV